MIRIMKYSERVSEGKDCKRSIALAATKILVSVEKVNILFHQHYLFHVREEVEVQKD